MILRELKVESFRGIAGPLELEFAPGVTLIAGPNGAGKSTLLAAVEAALAVPAKSAEAELYRRWGARTAPEVTLGFEHRGARYRVEKRLCEAGVVFREDVAAKGAAADELLRGLLIADKARERGVLRVLLARQDARGVELPPGLLRERLAAVMGEQATDERAMRLRVLLGKRFADEYQPKRGGLKKGHAALVAREELRRLQAELDAAVGLIKECERWEKAAAEARAEEAAAQREEERLEPLMDQVAKAIRFSEDAARAAKDLERAVDRLKERDVVEGIEARLAPLAARVAELEAAAQAAESAAAAARESELARIGEELRSLAGPSREAIQQARGWRDTTTALRFKIDAAQLRFSFMAEAAMEMEVLEGSPGGGHRLRGAESLTIQGEGRLRVRLPGLGVAEVAGPVQDLSKEKRELAEMERRWQGFTAEWGEDVERLEQKAARRLELEGRELQLRKSPPDAAVAAARAAWEAEARVKKELEKQRGQYPEMAAMAKREDLQAQLLDTQSRGEAAKQGMAALPAGIVERRLELDRQRKEAEASRTAARDRRRIAEGQAGALRQQAPFGGLERLQWAIGDKQLEVEERERAAAGLLLLYERMEAAYEREREGLTAPVEVAATRIYEAIAGVPPAKVVLNKDWEAGPDQHGAADYSSGEREQLQFAARLAWADLLAQEERQVLVLDDALVHTDAARLERAYGLLRERRERLQLIVLTCHPERYAEWAPERVYQLRAGALVTSSI